MKIHDDYEAAGQAVQDRYYSQEAHDERQTILIAIDKNEETAQAFNAQVKKEHEAVFAFITKKGIKPL